MVPKVYLSQILRRHGLQTYRCCKSDVAIVSKRATVANLTSPSKRSTEHVLFQVGHDFLYVSLSFLRLHSFWCESWGASRASLSSPRSAPAVIVDFIIVFVVVFVLLSEMGRLVRLAAHASLGALFHSGVRSCLCGRIHLCVRGWAPREPRFARLGWCSFSFWSS